jgi:hypothetical protein
LKENSHFFVENNDRFLRFFVKNNDHNIDPRSGHATPVSMEQKNVCHIRIEDLENTLLKLCPRSICV